MSKANVMANFAGTDQGLRELALFTGAGGGILGGKLLGWRTVCAVEYEPYAACVLVAKDRMTDFSRLSRFGMTFGPLTDDLGADVLTWFLAGFPAKTSAQPEKAPESTGDRSGLWMEMARIIGEVRPRYAFVENSPMLTSRGLGVVLGDLAAMGFDARWGVLGAADVGAPHLRERIWIVANDPRQ